MRLKLLKNVLKWLFVIFIYEIMRSFKCDKNWNHIEFSGEILDEIGKQGK